MKRFLLLAITLMLLITACSYYQKEVIPSATYTAPSMKEQNLTTGEHVVKTRYGFRLITIPISLPSPNTMVAEAIKEHGGKGITNLDVEFSEFNILLFQIPKMTVSGDIVK